jgi:hypothetical protein
VADEIRYEDIRPEPFWKKILKSLWSGIKFVGKKIWAGLKLLGNFIVLLLKAFYKWQLSIYDKWDKEFEEEERKKK